MGLILHIFGRINWGVQYQGIKFVVGIDPLLTDHMRGLRDYNRVLKLKKHATNSVAELSIPVSCGQHLQRYLRMDAVDGWMDGCMDGWKDGWTNNSGPDP